MCASVYRLAWQSMTRGWWSSSSTSQCVNLWRPCYSNPYGRSAQLRYYTIHTQVKTPYSLLYYNSHLDYAGKYFWALYITGTNSSRHLLTEWVIPLKCSRHRSSHRAPHHHHQQPFPRWNHQPQRTQAKQDKWWTTVSLPPYNTILTTVKRRQKSLKMITKYLYCTHTHTESKAERMH